MIIYIGMKKVIKLILLVAWMSLIFYLSAQAANDSTITTNFVIDALYKIYSLFSNKLDYVSFVELTFSPVRKIAHFTEFGILGVLSYINIREYKKDKVVLLSIVFSCLYAISDEVHQLFVPGRYCAIADMAIDTCGATIGILLIHLITKRWLKS